MNNLYGKIYEAINTGIQKALIIDPDNDISIGWSKKKITNAPDLLKTYVNNLLQNSDPEYYDLILQYHIDNPDEKYYVHNFEELQTIFDKVSSVCKNNLDLSWVDMSQVITVIMNNDAELQLYDIRDFNNVKCVRLNCEDICGHPIVFSTKYLKLKKLPWLYLNDDDYLDIEEYYDGTDFDYDHVTVLIGGDEEHKLSTIDYNGVDNTYKHWNCKNISDFHALKYCKNAKCPGYKGYLPAISELIFINDNYKLIKYVFNELNYEFPIFRSHEIWSSSELDELNAWYVNNSTWVTSYQSVNITRSSYPIPKNRCIDYDIKTNSRYVMPLFAKK